MGQENNATMPADFAYKWEPVGAGFLCAFCPAGRRHAHAWRAYSEKYGEAYVCPQHLLKIQQGFQGEGLAVWLAIRANKIKRLSVRNGVLEEIAREWK